MSKFEWDVTQARFQAAMERLKSVIEEYASFQTAMETEEKFLAKRRARLREARAHFAVLAGDVAETRRDLESLRQRTEEEEAHALEFEKRLSQQFGPLRSSW
ncbi:uncharacterized protein LOC119724304 [Patiria miniata]|uniref:Uncharacterized protein n=1 Tax=Patiria miniata TaxID=46514 RepID=A0A913ZJJ9_PATMI|nr:uncharacterized protein LOC119724304 [Patiria miniata]